MSDGRRLVGSWSCRSGNSVDVFLVGGLDGTGTIDCEWDRWPPTPADTEDWTARILPALTARVAELLERRGPALAIQP